MARQSTGWTPGDGRSSGNDNVRTTRTRNPQIGTPTRKRPESKPAAAIYSTGDKVRHGKFGEGIVMNCTPSASGDFEITVAFKEGHGVKRLLSSFANLEKVG